MSRLKSLILRLKRKYLSHSQIMKGSLVDLNSKIGMNTYLGYNCLVTKASIGNYCSIANNCSIGPGEHDLSQVSTSSLFYKDPYNDLTKKEVVIGNDVWIAANVVIRRGVTIGNGAVIGANSFVNCNVPDFAIFAGSPAKLIKYRFSEEKIIILNESGWWNLPLKEARLVIAELEKIK